MPHLQTKSAESIWTLSYKRRWLGLSRVGEPWQAHRQECLCHNILANEQSATAEASVPLRGIFGTAGWAEGCADTCLRSGQLRVYHLSRPQSRARRIA